MRHGIPSVSNLVPALAGASAYLLLRTGIHVTVRIASPRAIEFLQSSHLHITFKDYKFNNMNVKNMVPAADSAAALLRSLSHPQRLLVLCALVDGEKSVAELRQELGIEQVPMSQQLMRLRSDGLVESRREGTTVYYSIVRPEVLTVVGGLHSAFCAPTGGKRSRGDQARR